MERLKLNNERIKLDHQKRMEATKEAFSNLATKLKNNKPKANPALVKQWKKTSSQFDTAKAQLSAFAAKLSIQKKTKQKLLTERFYTLDLEISNTVKMRMYDEKRKLQFFAELGQAVPPCTEFTVRRQPDKYTVEYFGYGVLTISYLQLEESDFYEVVWVLDDNGHGPLQDTINLKYSDWFGGSIGPKQTWPTSGKHKLCPYVAWDTQYDPGNGYGSILERYWLSSAGIALYVDADVPLFVATDYDEKQELTLVSMFDKPYKNTFDHKLFLTYAILKSPDMKTAHDIIREELFFKSEGLPCPDLFRMPIWSIDTALRQEDGDWNLLDHVRALINHSIGPCIIEFKDDWTVKYGDMLFNPKLFPDIKEMIMEVKQRGFRVIVWVHPFASPMSSAFYAGVNYWVKSAMVGGVTTWKHGPAKLLDVTNPDAFTWFKRNLLHLQEEFGIDGFMFDYGQVNYLPTLCNTFESLTNPNTYTKNYLEMAFDITSPYCLGLTRCGVGTQNVPLMTCMEEKSTSWGWDNGLKTIIPSVLTLGIMGYRFILPGRIGGHTAQPSSELYVRWLENVLLMPGLQFSWPPWYYGEETLGLVHKLLALRDSFLEYLERVATDSVQTGDPMVRPLWWKAPEDSIAQTIDSQFMLGDQLLVAPLQEKGAHHRAIYLPWGVWKDQLRGTSVQGNCWLYSYRARLGEVPHFTLIHDKTAHDTGLQA